MSGPYTPTSADGLTYLAGESVSARAAQLIALLHALESLSRVLDETRAVLEETNKAFQETDKRFPPIFNHPVTIPEAPDQVRLRRQVQQAMWVQLENRS